MFLRNIFLAAPLLLPSLSSAKDAPPAFAAAIASLQGSAEVLLDGIDPWQPAKAGMSLSPGTQLRTGPGAEIIVLFFEGSKVRVGPQSQFRLDSAQPAKIAVFMGLGKLSAWVAKIKGRSFQARSVNAVASVRGTIFSMLVAANGATNFELFSGILALTDSFGHNMALASGQSVAAPPKAGFAAPKALPQGLPPPPEPPATMKMVMDAAREQGLPPPMPNGPNKGEPGHPPQPGGPHQPPPGEIPGDGPGGPPPLPPLPPPNPEQNLCPPGGSVSPSAPCP